MHTSHCTLHTAHCTLHTVHCTMYTLHCTLYTVHCRLNTVRCTLYTVHCTLSSSTCCLFLGPSMLGPRLLSLTQSTLKMKQGAVWCSEMQYGAEKGSTVQCSASSRLQCSEVQCSSPQAVLCRGVQCNVNCRHAISLTQPKVVVTTALSLPALLPSITKVQSTVQCCAVLCYVHCTVQ